MNSDTIPSLPDNHPELRLPWHKPEIQQLTISLDTAIGTGSSEDGDGFERGGVVVISDLRVKMGIAGIQDALPAVLALNGADARHRTVDYVHLVPLLAEAIRQQQSMIVELQTQVEGLRKKSS